MNPPPSLIWHTNDVFSAAGLLSHGECQQLLATAQQHGFEPAMVRARSGTQAMPAVRNNQRLLVELPVWRGLLWARLQALGLPVLHHQQAVGLPRALRFYEYTAGQRFRMHKDGPWVEDGLTSQLTVLVYLNDAFTGGDTGFKQFRVTPRTGDALVFVHDTWHEGAPVEQGTKYVLRSDILYAPAVPTPAALLS